MVSRLSTRSGLIVPYGSDPVLTAIRQARDDMRDSYAQALVSEDYARTPLEWAERYRAPRGIPFTLSNFRPLRKIYEDTHPHIVIMKPAQRGASELAINWMMHALDCGLKAWNLPGNKLNGAYIFPDQGALNDFSRERFGQLPQESAYIRRLWSEGRADDVTFKRFRNNYLYLRGAWTDTGLKSFPADVMVLDEYDEIRPAAIELARRRMNASTIHREVDLSTPRFPGQGIHAAYLMSDQHEYETRCPTCNLWTVFDFYRDIRVDGVPYETPGGQGWRYWSTLDILSSDVALTCPSCGHELTKEERCADGRWEARQERSPIRGYHIPWWPFPMVNLAAFAAKAASPMPEAITEFWRSDLGKPFSPSGASISREMIMQASAELDNGQLPWQINLNRMHLSATMGIDVGAVIHYWVTVRLPGEPRPYVADAGAVTDWHALNDLMAYWRVRLCIIDALPETTMAKAFQASHRGRVLLAFYTDTGAESYQPDAKKAHEQGVVKLNRTLALDAVLGNFTAAGWHVPAKIANDQMVIDHLTAMTRVSVKNAKGDTVTQWVHTQPDHMMHAAAYCIMARTLMADIGNLPGVQPTMSHPVAQASTPGWGSDIRG